MRQLTETCFISDDEFIAVAHMTSELNEKVMCDFGHKFHANSALLIPFCNTTSASLGETMFVNKENASLAHIVVDST